MIIEKRVRNKYHQGFPRQREDVNQIVIHATGGGESALGLIEWILKGEREKDYKRGIALFHYLIDFDGSIYQIISPDNWVYHSSSGKHDQNTIGIELMNNKAGNLGSFTPQQYQSLGELICDGAMKFFNIQSIIGHTKCASIYSPNWKPPTPCPGPNFDWQILIDELISCDYKFIADIEYIHNII